MKPVYVSALEGIKSELLSVSERSNAVGYREDDADVRAVCDLAENIRDAIIEYQVGSDLPVHQECTTEPPSSWLNKKRSTGRTSK